MSAELSVPTPEDLAKAQLATASTLTRARSNLVFDHPFFGAIALRLKMVETLDMPTMGVDGYNIFYNPFFVATMKAEETNGVLAHEVLHVAMLHHTRLGNRNRQIWNMACDYAINPIVFKNNMVLPKDCLYEDKYKNMTAEDVYEDLLKDPEIQKALAAGEELKEAIEKALGEAAENGQKGFDEILAPPEDKAEEAEQDAKSLTNTGLAAAKQAGKLPGGLEELIDAAHENQVNWKERLRDLLTTTVRGDQVWHRPNMRMLDQVYLPHYEQEPAGNLVLAIDTSGSVSQHELSIYGGEIKAIMLDNHIEKLTVLYVDTKVQKVEVFEVDDDFELRVKGRGGTEFEPAFDWVEEQGDDRPNALLYFTDGEANFPADPPNYPVIWCITSRFKEIEAPWGDTIQLKFKEN